MGDDDMEMPAWIEGSDAQMVEWREEGQGRDGIDGGEGRKHSDGRERRRDGRRQGAGNEEAGG